MNNHLTISSKDKPELTNRFNNPVIIIGMHRSGTTMITRHLQSMGVFMGVWLDVNDESKYFQKLNNWLLTQTGGSWIYPHSFKDLLNSTDSLPLVKDYLHQVADSPQSILYLGLRRYLETRGIYNQNSPWGWKDPRNTFTLPLWLQLFPGAQVIHVFRHGVDVAQSLRVRRTKLLHRAQIRYFQNRWINNLIPRRKGFADSERCSTLSGGFTLWQEYTAQGLELVHSIDSPTLSIKYEDYLQSPEEHLIKLAQFINRPVSNHMVKKLISGIRADRCYAFRRDPELLEFAQQNETQLAQFDYKSE